MHVCKIRRSTYYGRLWEIAALLESSSILYYTHIRLSRSNVLLLVHAISLAMLRAWQLLFVQSPMCVCERSYFVAYANWYKWQNYTIHGNVHLFLAAALCNPICISVATIFDKSLTQSTPKSHTLHPIAEKGIVTIPYRGVAVPDPMLTIFHLICKCTNTKRWFDFSW